MKIRPYDAEDARPLAKLYAESVEGIGRRDYSARQVEAWASLAPSPERLHALSADGRTRLVAVDGSGRPIAFADLETDGRIHFLYCSPEMVGKGVASAVYEELERIARERGVSRLHAEASEAARRFFLRKGFAVTSKRRFKVSGVEIHNYGVEKTLKTRGDGLGSER